MFGTRLCRPSAGGQIPLAEPRVARRWACWPTVGGFSDAEKACSKRLGTRRTLHLKHWGQQLTVYRELRARDMSEDAASVVAVNCRCWWMNSARMMDVAFPIRHFDQLGVPRLATQPQLPEPSDVA